MSDRFRGREGRADGIRAILHAPESHTLIVLSADPETIFDPSGEKSTDQIEPLCALAFSVLSSSVAAKEAKKRQFRRKRGDFGPKRTRIPDFDALIPGSGHNLGSIW